MLRKYLNLDYLYLFLCIAWVPLQIFVLKVDGAGRTLAALAVVIIFLNINKKVLWQFMSEKPYRYWCLWLIFSFVNAAVITKVQGEPLVFFFNILHPLMMLFLVYKKHELQIERLINVAIIGLYFYLFLIFVFYSGALLMNRGATGDLNANAIALNAVSLLFLTCLKFQLGRLTLNKFLMFSIAPVVLLVICASRTAFIGSTIIILGLVFGKMSGSFIKKIFVLAFGCIAFYGFLNFVLADTYLGERLLFSTEQAEQQNLAVTGTILDKMGDRGVFYYYGFKVFLNNVLTGIGLGGFVLQPPLYLKNHSEYMAQLSEGGVIGFSLFVAFYFWIFVKILAFKNVTEKSNLLFLFFSFLAIIAMNLTNISYMSIPVFIILAVIIKVLKQPVGQVNEK